MSNVVSLRTILVLGTVIQFNLEILLSSSVVGLNFPHQFSRLTRFAGNAKTRGLMSQWNAWNFASVSVTMNKNNKKFYLTLGQP